MDESRSRLRRIAIEKGEPAPRFDALPTCWLTGDDCPVCGLPIATDGRETWCTRCEVEKIGGTQEDGRDE